MTSSTTMPRWDTHKCRRPTTIVALVLLVSPLLFPKLLPLTIDIQLRIHRQHPSELRRKRNEQTTCCPQSQPRTVDEKHIVDRIQYQTPRPRTKHDPFLRHSNESTVRKRPRPIDAAYLWITPISASRKIIVSAGVSAHPRV